MAEQREPISPTVDIILYRIQASPYCERVVRRLEDYDLEYESRFVMPNHSERDLIKETCGSRLVPALVDTRTGVRMIESAHIVEYLERTYGEKA